MVKFVKFCLALLLGMPAFPVLAQSQQADHHISFSNRQNQYVDVRLRLISGAGG